MAFFRTKTNKAHQGTPNYLFRQLQTVKTVADSYYSCRLPQQLQTGKTTANSCRLSRQLNIVEGNCRHVFSCLFSQRMTESDPEWVALRQWLAFQAKTVVKNSLPRASTFCFEIVEASLIFYDSLVCVSVYCTVVTHGLC